MSDGNKPRDIFHELADVSQLLGDGYTITSVECDPGDSAIRIAKRNSEKTLYVIAYSDPDDTEIQSYDENDSLTTYRVFTDGSLGDSTPEEIADYIIEAIQ